MPPEEPRWWYSEDGHRDWRRWALGPAGWLYGTITTRRFGKIEPYRSRLPVICAGNFTAGGTGKTPLAILIAQTLIVLGETPVFLTRGYGGRATGPRWVDPDVDTAREVGDEPLLLARAAPVMLARDRRAGVLAIESSGRPASVIVMDDGLQNPSVRKDLSIALVDGVRGIGNGEVIPAGPLRAPLEFQLGLVDAIVVNGGGGEDEAAPGSAVLARLRRGFPGPVLAADVAPAGDVDWLKGATVVAFAGIGHPEQFFATLEALGARLVVRAAFPDHHAFSEAEADRLLKAARGGGALLVTTQKDWARLGNTGGLRSQLQEVARVLPVTLTFEDRDMRRLVSLVETAAKTGGYRQGTTQR